MKQLLRSSVLAFAPLAFISVFASSPPALSETSSCNEAGGPIAVSSPNLDYFKALYAKASSGQDVDLSEYLKLFKPQDGDGSNLESPFFACENGPMGNFQSTDGSTVVAPNCHPDILYSWGPQVKMDILTGLADGQTWQGPINPLGQILGGVEFTSISPVTTFGYGDILFRFKIKPSTPYNYESFGATGAEIGVRADTYHDFAIADSSVIESVSMGTPEIYDEVVRDILRFESGKRVSAYNTVDGTALDRLYSQLVDGHDQSETHLKANLTLMLGQILNGQGVLQYNQGVCRNRRLTFSTAFPAYFEPLHSPSGLRPKVNRRRHVVNKKKVA